MLLLTKSEIFASHVFCNDICQNNSFHSYTDELLQCRITFLAVTLRLSDAILMLVQA